MLASATPAPCMSELHFPWRDARCLLVFLCTNSLKQKSFLQHKVRRMKHTRIVCVMKNHVCLLNKLTVTPSFSY